MLIDLLNRKKTHFVLWRPGAAQPSPSLYIGNIKPNDPDRLKKLREIQLKQSTEFPEL